MASIVFSGIGQAAAGPLGATAGALLGGAVDRLAGERRSRYDAPHLSFTSSSYGDVIPRIFGRYRVPGVLIWSTQPRRVGARKGGSPDRRSYVASFAIALASRPLRQVGRIWADGREIRNADGVFDQAITMRTYAGTRFQDCDPLIVAEEGIDATPAYRGLAYVVFEDFPLAPFGNRIPSLAFEVIADDAAVDTGAWIAELVFGAGAPRPQPGACLPVEGFAATGLGRDDATSIATLVDLRLVNSGGEIRIVENPETFKVSREAILGKGHSSDLATDVHVSLNPDARIRACSVSYLDVARDYQSGRQEMSGLSGARSQRFSGQVAATASMARSMAETLSARLNAQSEELELSMSWDALAIPVGATLRVEGIFGDWSIQHREVGRGVVTLRCTRAHGRKGVGRTSDAGRPLIRPARPPAPTSFELFEVPFASNAPAAGAVHVVPLGQDNWRGAEFAWTVSSTGGRALGWLDEAVSHGSLVMELANGPSAIWDETNVVDLTGFWNGGGPLGRPVQDLLQGQNLLVVGDEVLQFREAEQIGAERYRLSGLLRGRRGTIARQHPAGTRWFLFDEPVLAAIPLSYDLVGATLRVEAVGPGDGDAPAVREQTIQGAGASVLAPCQVRLRTTAEGGISLSWIPRTRGALDWYAPQAELAHWYRLRMEWEAGGQSQAWSGRTGGTSIGLPAPIAFALRLATPGSIRCEIEAEGVGPLHLRTTGILAMRRID